MTLKIIIATLGQLLLSTAAFWSASAQAALLPVERTSSVSASSYYCNLFCFYGYEPSYTDNASLERTDFLEFDEAVASSPNTRATQQSAFGEDWVRVTASGTAAGWSTEFGTNTALSVFSLEFTVNTATTFTLTGGAALNGVVTSGNASVRLFGAGIAIDRSLISGFNPNLVNSTLAIHDSGLLLPGTYALDIISSVLTSSVAGGTISSASTSAELMLTPVPLPAAAWLLAPGLFMLGGMRRRPETRLPSD